MLDIEGAKIFYKTYSTNKSDPKFSIVIPSWNNLSYLQNCIASIYKNSKFSHQIIVFVNDGSDGTLEWVEKKKIDHAHCHKNLGVCYALNAARSLVKSDYFLFMNDDMYVCPAWDDFLWREIENAGNDLFFFSSTMIQPHGINDNSVIVENYGTSIDDFDEEKLLKGFASHDKGDWSGATWPPNVVSTRCWDLVGGYSVEFSPGMYSDPDFSRKLWEAGVRNFKGIGKSRVYHFSQVSTGKIRKNMGSKTFLMKWGITSGTFCKYYLKRGEPYAGKLKAPTGFKFRLSLLRCKIKKIVFSIFK